MQAAEEEVQAKSRNDEDSINFRPSPNFKHMKKYLKSKFEEANQMSDQSSPTEMTDASARTNVLQDVNHNANVQPPLPPNPPPPDSPPMITNLKQEIVDDEYQNNDTNSQEFIQTDELRTTIKTDQSEATEQPNVIMCRNFVRGTCKKGAACIFAHKLILSQLPGVYTFCRNFQNSVCSFPKCKFVHATVFEKEYFFRSGYLPPHTLAHLKENISSQPDPSPQAEETPGNTPAAAYPLGLAPPPPPAKPCMVPTHMNYAVPDSTCNIYGTPVLGQKRDWAGDEHEVSSSTEVPLLSNGHSPAKKCKMCDSTEIREELLKRRFESHKQKIEELNQKNRVLQMKTARISSVVAALFKPKMPGTQGKDNGLLGSPNFAAYVAKMLLNTDSVVPPDAS
ncbi:uncharacterized protein LOC111361038 [Spodoptera litura]|uniref:Uncharacterized protein LOC111361038 n=1 Tax=Spodoptera litura TaxID=69820 RepID=A0A9J7ER49_SPOLT|nr:uncharacterized protein LOC111361038 [Spodoptera litura]